MFILEHSPHVGSFFRRPFLRNVAVVGRFGTECVYFGWRRQHVRDAVMAAWDALHGAMRAWGIRSREGLSEWVHAQGFPQPRWGAHFSGRAQERLLNAAANHDARVSALETAYVQVTLQAYEQGVRELDQNLFHRRTIDAPALPAQSWEALDPIDLAEVFQIRFPVLQSCPFQFRGRYRHAPKQHFKSVTMQPWSRTSRGRPERGNCSLCCPSCCCTEFQGSHT